LWSGAADGRPVYERVEQVRWKRRALLHAARCGFHLGESDAHGRQRVIFRGRSRERERADSVSMRLQEQIELAEFACALAVFGDVSSPCVGARIAYGAGQRADPATDEWPGIQSHAFGRERDGVVAIAIASAI